MTDGSFLDQGTGRPLDVVVSADIAVWLASLFSFCKDAEVVKDVLWVLRLIQGLKFKIRKS